MGLFFYIDFNLCSGVQWWNRGYWGWWIWGGDRERSAFLLLGRVCLPPSLLGTYTLIGTICLTVKIPVNNQVSCMYHEMDKLSKNDSLNVTLGLFLASAWWCPPSLVYPTAWRLFKNVVFCAQNDLLSCRKPLILNIPRLCTMSACVSSF